MSATAKRFHTREELPEAERREGEEKAKTQEQVIRFFFNCRPIGERFTPFQISEICFRNKIPITSVRRSLTNLTEAGFLDKSSEVKRQGNFGADNCTWARTNPMPNPQADLFAGGEP